jgi:hypothetical protein
VLSTERVSRTGEFYLHGPVKKGEAFFGVFRLTWAWSKLNRVILPVDFFSYSGAPDKIY